MYEEVCWICLSKFIVIFRWKLIYKETRRRRKKQQNETEDLELIMISASTLSILYNKKSRRNMKSWYFTDLGK